MNKCLKVILPIFPITKFLVRKWWHRLMLVVAIATYVICVIISIVFFVNTYKVTNKEQIILNSTQMENYQNEQGNPKITFREQKNTKSGEIRWVGEKVIVRYDFFIAITVSLIVVLFGMFGVSTIYRIILYIVYGQDYL